MQFLRRSTKVLYVALTTVLGCSSQPSSSPATLPVAHATPPPARPFMISEANLPAGFPPPGPVDVVLIKQYPACREARVEALDGESDSMFMSLFNHIKTNDIPMTAPVEMTYDNRESSAQNPKLVAMAFVYAKPGTGATGTQGKVRVVDLPAQAVVSIGMRGGYNQNNLNRAVQKLQDFLAAHPQEYRVTGLPRYLGYNSPFVPPFLRYGEVQLPIAILPAPLPPVP